MKRLSAVLAISLISVYCFAQTQTGDASYNASKGGLTLAHPSMSFGTRVRITNEKNNREVIAAVDGRIPAADPRVADISREAGDAIGMSQTGYTRVRLEQLIPDQPAAVSPAPPPVQEPPPAVREAPPPEAPAPPPAQEPRIETIQLVSPPQAPPSIQYVALPLETQNCFNSPLCVAILVLLIIAVLLLTAILVLLLCNRRIPWWPWYYPVWLRRRLRYLKKRVC
jgi:hypothetical protein